MRTSVLRLSVLARGASLGCHPPAQRSLLSFSMVVPRTLGVPTITVTGALAHCRRHVHTTNVSAASCAASAHCCETSVHDNTPAAATPAARTTAAAIAAAARCGTGLGDGPPTPRDQSATNVNKAAEHPSSDAKENATMPGAKPAEVNEGSEPPSPQRQSLWQRGWRAVKSEGKDFSIFYFPFYIGTFIFFYTAFATGMLHKEKLLDAVLSLMGSWVNREKLYERIAAWDAWVDLGFAVAINELIEVVRFPVVFLLYYVTKPYSNHLAQWMAKCARRLRWSRK